METIEITANTIEEATKKAAEKFGTDASNVVVTVIEQTKGLFGKGSVRVKAELKSDGGEEKPAPKGKAKAAKPASKAPAKKSKATSDEPVAEVVSDQAVAAVEEPTVSDDSEPATESEKEVEASQADEDRIVKLVADLLAAADLEASISGSSRSGKYVSVAIDGKDVAHLVGKHGEVLNALQYLVNVTIAQQMKNGVRATIDGQNYRQKREEALTKLATQIANEVAKRQEEAVLDALPAFERRIIHKVLAEIEGITTYSEGEEPNRRVVIAPAEA